MNYSKKIAKYTIATTAITEDHGRYRDKTTTTASVLEDGNEIPLFTTTSTSISGHLLRKGSHGTSEPCATDVAYQWLMDNKPDAKQWVAAEEVENQRLQAIAAEKKAATIAQLKDNVTQLFATTSDPVQVFVDLAMFEMATSELVSKSGIPTKQFNQILAKESLITRVGKTWTTDPVFGFTTSKGTIQWNARGHKKVWELLKEKGLVSSSWIKMVSSLRYSLANVKHAAFTACIPALQARGLWD